MNRLVASIAFQLTFPTWRMLFEMEQLIQMQNPSILYNTNYHIHILMHVFIHFVVNMANSRSRKLSNDTKAMKLLVNNRFVQGERTQFWSFETVIIVTNKVTFHIVWAQTLELDHFVEVIKFESVRRLRFIHYKHKQTRTSTWLDANCCNRYMSRIK